MRLTPLLLLLALAAPFARATASDSDRFTASVVRVRAIAPDGALRLGSGVVIGPDRVVTACHVTRNASSIQIVAGARRWTTRVQTGSVARDVCVLSVAPARLDLPVAELRDSAQLHDGERVLAVSFPGTRRSPVVSEGVVAGLYRYDGGDVVRITAKIDFGSSGGALLDDAGRVVGLVAFKSSVDDRRYAVPSEWIADAVRAPTVDFPLDHTVPAIAFWERTLLDRPAFLDYGGRATAGDN